MHIVYPLFGVGVGVPRAAPIVSTVQGRSLPLAVRKCYARI